MENGEEVHRVDSPDVLQKPVRKRSFRMDRSGKSLYDLQTAQQFLFNFRLQLLADLSTGVINFMHKGRVIMIHEVHDFLHVSLQDCRGICLWLTSHTSHR
jgi:hypothetical protein